MLNGHLLIQKESKQSSFQQNAENEELAVRAQLVTLAENEIGTREKTGHNDGIKVESYLAMVHLKRGEPYCAAFISYIFNKAGFDQPRSGWSPDMFPNSRLARSALPANLLAIYYPEKGRIAHVGMIVKEDGDYIVSVEGNTNVDGSKEEAGVYLKRRHRKTIYRMADWVSGRGSIK